MRATLMAMAAMQGLTHLPWGFSKGSTRNKYQPHQGKKEITRRLRGKPVSKPRRMWRLGNEGDRYPRYSGWQLRESTRRPLILTSKILGCSVVMWP